MTPAHTHARPFILRGIQTPIPKLPGIATVKRLDKDDAYELIHPFVVELIQTSTALNNATHGSISDGDFKQYITPLNTKVKAMEAALKPYRRYMPRS
jgi:hypothetical protein